MKMVKSSQDFGKLILKSSIKPPGGLFFSSPFERVLNRDGGFFERGGGY